MIARQTKAGYESVYCHWDGYPSHNGVILQTHYSDSEILGQLLSFGDISVLGPLIGAKHDFGQAGYSPFTTFYGRDGGATDGSTGPIQHVSLSEVLQRADACGCEYVYVFDGIAWSYCDRESQFFGLSDGAEFSTFQRIEDKLSVK